MNRTARYGMVPALTLALGACTLPEPTPPPDQGGVPEAVVALAAPGQNVQTARVLPEDGCYWYEHVGPVETTLLPLRTRDGSRICSGKRS